MAKVHWVIPCPVCDNRLRIADHSYLGRRGQCPACRHKFVLEMPKAQGFTSKPRSSGRNLEAAPPDETLKHDFDVRLCPAPDQEPAAEHGSAPDHEASR